MRSVSRRIFVLGGLDDKGNAVVVWADDPGMVRLIEAYGHQVVATAGTGPETLDALLTWRPDAVVDVRMPPTRSDEGLRSSSRDRGDDLLFATRDHDLLRTDERRPAAGPLR
jgi:CheY-like chemotaxis protein